MDEMVSPATSRKHVVWGAVSLAATLAVLVLFIECCWSAAADAQGAILFVIAAPVLAIGLGISFKLARRAQPWRGSRVARGVAMSLAVLIALFYVTALVPGLRFFPDGVIHLVSRSYESTTGNTPYAADKHR